MKTSERFASVLVRRSNKKDAPAEWLTSGLQILYFVLHDLPLHGFLLQRLCCREIPPPQLLRSRASIIKKEKKERKKQRSNGLTRNVDAIFDVGSFRSRKYFYTNTGEELENSTFLIALLKILRESVDPIWLERMLYFNRYLDTRENSFQTWF